MVDWLVSGKVEDEVVNYLKDVRRKARVIHCLYPAPKLFRCCLQCAGGRSVEQLIEFSND